MQDVYIRLAQHMETLIMGYPYSEELLDLLKEMFSPDEARVATAIPNDLAPLEVVGIDAIAARTDLPRSAVTTALESLLGRAGRCQSQAHGQARIELFFHTHHRQGVRGRCNQDI
jgi:hypothetical protein